MSPSSTSSSNPVRRVQRGGLILLAALLLIEAVLRLPPVDAWLDVNIAPYENLLWYDSFMPSYAADLRQSGPYEIWLIGSSYMMTGLDPALIYEDLAANGFGSLRVQNYGMNRMTNLTTMSQMLDAWLLNLSTPQYMVLGLSVRNFIPVAGETTAAETSPYESIFIFPESLDDRIAGLLYQNSALYRGAVLARNATLLPLSSTLRSPRGGYVNRRQTLDCAAQLRPELANDPDLRLDVPAGLARLDVLLSVLERRDIPVLVVGIPAPACTVDFFYGGYDAYMQTYVGAVEAHLGARGVAFSMLDARFNAFATPPEQTLFFEDAHHPNAQGADVFSAWTAEALVSWLSEMQ